MLTLQSPVTGTHLRRPKIARRPLQPITSQTNIQPPPIANTYQKPDLNLQSIEISEDSNKENPNQNEKRNPTSKPDLNLQSIEISEDSNKEHPNQNQKRNHTSKPDLNLRSIEISEDSNKEKINQNEKRNPAPKPDQIEQFEVSLAEELSAIREKMERLRSDKEKTEKMLRERELMMDLKMKELDQRGQIQKVFEMEVDRLYRLNELRSLCNRILPIRSLREKEQEKIKPDKSQGGKAEEESGEENVMNPSIKLKN